MADIGRTLVENCETNNGNNVEIVEIIETYRNLTKNSGMGVLECIRMCFNVSWQQKYEYGLSSQFHYRSKNRLEILS